MISQKLFIKKRSRGFFIAIVGILASVVLASLNTAREKGYDASVKANLNSIRAQAELYYDDSSNSYLGLCQDSTIRSALGAAEQASFNKSVCVDTSSAFAVEVELRTGGYYCIDSTGVAAENQRSSNLSVSNPECDN